MRFQKPSTNVELLQQLPPTLTVFVVGCVLPSAPDPTPGWVGFAHDAQPAVLKFPPYERQRSMPKYMPVW